MPLPDPGGRIPEVASVVGRFGEIAPSRQQPRDERRSGPHALGRGAGGVSVSRNAALSAAERAKDENHAAAPPRAHPGSPASGIRTPAGLPEGRGRGLKGARGLPRPRGLQSPFRVSIPEFWNPQTTTPEIVPPKPLLRLSISPPNATKSCSVKFGSEYMWSIDGDHIPSDRTL